jgi:hypothetical protein
LVDKLVVQLIIKCKLSATDSGADDVWARCQSKGITGFLASDGSRCLGMLRGDQNLVFQMIETLLQTGEMKDLNVLGECEAPMQGALGEKFPHFAKVFKSSCIDTDIEVLAPFMQTTLNPEYETVPC